MGKRQRFIMIVSTSPSLPFLSLTMNGRGPLASGYFSGVTDLPPSDHTGTPESA